MNYWKRLINVVVWIVVAVGLFLALWILLHWPGWLSAILAISAAQMTTAYLEEEQEQKPEQKDG